jgi:hypothetical protein
MEEEAEGGPYTDLWPTKLDRAAVEEGVDRKSSLSQVPIPSSRRPPSPPA